MQQRRALLVAGAGGAPETVADTLGRFGFGTIVPVPSLEQALARLRAEPFDLLLVPLQHIDPVQLSALEREIRSRPSLSVIGTAPAADADLILRALRAGVHEFLVLPPSPQDLAAAVERLARRSGAPARSGQVFAIYSPKGGLGSTSIAVNLAYALAAHSPKARIALADCVFARGDVRVFLNLQPTYDMGDVVRKLDEVDGAMLQSLMTGTPGNVSVLPASDDLVFDDEFDAVAVAAVIDQLRMNFDVTIVDCEHHMSERTLAILDAADRIFLVTQANIPALRATRRMLEVFARVGYADTKSHVILNRYQAGDAVTLKSVTDSLGRDVYWSLPNDYRTSAASLNRGVSVAQADVRSKLTRSYAQLAEKLRGSPAPTRSGAAAAASQRSKLRGLFGLHGGTPSVT